MMTSSCCHKAPEDNHKGHDHTPPRRDWMILICAPLIAIPYLMAVAGFHTDGWIGTYIHSVHEFVNTMWWGVLVGIFFLALLSKIPREFVMSVLGTKRGAGGITRAMGAGVLLDLCSHGILMVGAKLYQRGASLGQVMAFLIASPWNSISLTFILIAMIGLKLTLIFLVLSCVVAFIAGMIFDALVKSRVLPDNPNSFAMPENFHFWPEAKRRLASVKWTPAFIGSMLRDGAKDSTMVLRWLLFGIVLASVLRLFFTPESFAEWFGPTMLGMIATVFFATILEACSEGSSPIAADLVNRAGAPGNAFTFLMAGVATDYTEIMVLKDTTKSWKIALFLPLITLPQVIILGVLLNIAL